MKKFLAEHPNVGDIRGGGLFWGIEFVKDKRTKQPFPPEVGISQKILELAISPQFNMTFYPGTGSVDGIQGDHIILAPPFNITNEDVDNIVTVVVAVIQLVFSEMAG